MPGQVLTGWSDLRGRRVSSPRGPAASRPGCCDAAVLACGPGFQAGGPGLAVASPGALAGLLLSSSQLHEQPT